jgi:hypothetical protein
MATAAAAPPAARFPAPAARDPPPAAASPWLASTSPSTTSSATASPQPASPVQSRAPSWGVPPHLQAQARQLRTRRSPLYVPAVLRPTEAPAGTSPPKKKEGGGGGGGGSPGDDGGLASEPESVVSPVSTTSIRRMVTEEWNGESRSDVAGPPSRNHWKVSELHCPRLACFA